MMRKVVVENRTNRIVNVIEAEDGFEIEGHTLIADQKAGPGWSYDGSAFTPPAPRVVTREELKLSVEMKKRTQIVDVLASEDVDTEAKLVAAIRSVKTRASELETAIDAGSAVDPGEGTIDGRGKWPGRSAKAVAPEQPTRPRRAKL